MGQRCYLKTGTVTNYLMDRWVPATWYVVGGTPGAKFLYRKPPDPRDPYHEYQFYIEAPLDAARRHLIEQFNGIRVLLKALSDGTHSPFGLPLPEQYAQGSTAWHSFRQVFVVFHPLHYVDVLEMLSLARDRHKTVVLDATERMIDGNENDRLSHLEQWCAFLTVTSFLRAVNKGDVATMCKVSELMRSGGLFCDTPNIAKNLAAWCTIAFDELGSREHVAEYLIGEEMLWKMDGTSFF